MRGLEGGYRSGQLAAKAGVSADTLRHYERRFRRGQAAPNGYRLHAPEAVVASSPSSARWRRLQSGRVAGYCVPATGASPVP
jgi:hypothetical protein